MKNLNQMGVQEMKPIEQCDVDGGFFPLVIAGVYLSAKVVAGLSILAAGAGVVVGVQIAKS